MAYDTSNLRGNRAGKTPETSNGPSPQAGLYRHPESGAEIITTYDPLFGDAQSDGVIRAGFERVGDAPEGSIKTIIEVNQEVRESGGSEKSRIDALELESLRREKREREEAEEKTKVKAEAAKAPAVKKEDK